MQNCLSYFSCGDTMTCINIGVLCHFFHCNQIHVTPGQVKEVQMCVPTSGNPLTTPLCCSFALTDEMQVFLSCACNTQIRQEEEAESPWSRSSFQTCSGVCLHGKGEGQCQRRQGWEEAHYSKSQGFIRTPKCYESR